LGKPNVVFEVAGILPVNDGKIREWFDYIVA
jgi:limonene-1,2-epoxide hydrolase